jgi:PAS domain S-box-containing protein
MDSNLDDLRELTQILNNRDSEAIKVNELLSHVAESTDGYFDWIVGSDDEYLSDNFKMQLGYLPHEMPNKVESWQKIIHPDDLKKVYNTLELHIASKGAISCQTQCRYTHKQGHEVLILCRGKVIEWDGDRPLRFVGVHILLSDG